MIITFIFTVYLLNQSATPYRFSFLAHPLCKRVSDWYMITHDVLLSLGLTTRPLNSYNYKGVVGQLTPETGSFQFDGLSPILYSIGDLKFILSLIDQEESEQEE